MMTTIMLATQQDASKVAFGTSGLRGLVSDMTDKTCGIYIMAFLQYLQQSQVITLGDSVAVAGDLRDSTPRILAAVCHAIEKSGYQVIYCGDIPSPAVALYGLKEKIATIMVTGSHIPADRNGVKFTTPAGEINKADEQAILQQQVVIDENDYTEQGALRRIVDLPTPDWLAEQYYIQRFVDFFPSACLAGKKVGIYAHSSVSSRCMQAILARLGADTMVLGQSDDFIPVDTEAVREQDKSLARQWMQHHRSLDCLVSTDGDGDRPLISDEHGEWLRGDIIGLLCANYLQAQAVVTPISSNSIIDKCGYFAEVKKTQIGSPYVIAAMEKICQQYTSVVGYEANGGFLQASTLYREGRALAPLPTRDAMIVLIALIRLSVERDRPLSAIAAGLPARFPASDRIKEVSPEISRRFLNQLIQQVRGEQEKPLLAQLGVTTEVEDIDLTDGVRLTLSNGDIVHFRASGNAPELRCYTESTSSQAAHTLNQQCLLAVKEQLSRMV